MTGLNLFGLFAVTVMVICYALEQRHSAFLLAFAASCVLASVYGFLQGAWPFGIVEGIWSVVAVKRWYQHGLHAQALLGAQLDNFSAAKNRRAGRGEVI